MQTRYLREMLADFRTCLRVVGVGESSIDPSGAWKSA
jgi:hypothetical protein